MHTVLIITRRERERTHTSRHACIYSIDGDGGHRTTTYVREVPAPRRANLQLSVVAAAALVDGAASAVVLVGLVQRAAAVLLLAVAEDLAVDAVQRHGYRQALGFHLLMMSGHRQQQQHAQHKNRGHPQHLLHIYIQAGVMMIVSFCL
jgi:phosphoribosylanthranilate isomerase